MGKLRIRDMIIEIDGEAYASREIFIHTTLRGHIRVSKGSLEGELDFEDAETKIDESLIYISKGDLSRLNSNHLFKIIRLRGGLRVLSNSMIHEASEVEILFQNVKGALTLSLDPLTIVFRSGEAGSSIEKLFHTVRVTVRPLLQPLIHE